MLVAWHAWHRHDTAWDSRVQIRLGLSREECTLEIRMNYLYRRIMSTNQAIWNLKGIFVDQWSPPPNWISAIQWFVQPWEQSAKSERLDHQIFAQLSIDCATAHWVGVCHRLLVLGCWSLRVSAQRQSAFLKTCAEMTLNYNTFNWAGRCDKVEKLRHFGARQTSHAMRLWDGTCLNTISCYIFEWPSTNPRLFCVLTYHRASTRRVDVIFGKGSAFVFWFHRRQPAMLFGLKLS